MKNELKEALSYLNKSQLNTFQIVINRMNKRQLKIFLDKIIDNRVFQRFLSTILNRINNMSETELKNTFNVINNTNGIQFETMMEIMMDIPKILEDISHINESELKEFLDELDDAYLNIQRDNMTLGSELLGNYNFYAVFGIIKCLTKEEYEERQKYGLDANGFAEYESVKMIIKQMPNFYEIEKDKHIKLLSKLWNMLLRISLLNAVIEKSKEQKFDIDTLNKQLEFLKPWYEDTLEYILLLTKKDIDTVKLPKEIEELKHNIEFIQEELSKSSSKNGYKK